MEKTFYFMAGLPRTGSTLLSSLLNQNPNIYSGPSSPVLPTLQTIQNHFETNELFAAYPKMKEAEQILASITPQFYSDVNKKVIIDKNRVWPLRLDLIYNYITPTPKIICPVRDVAEILTSIIMMIRRNPYYEGKGELNFIDKNLTKKDLSLTDFNRCQYLVGKEGIVGQSATALYECLVNGNQSSLYFVEYKDLINNPQETMSGIYDFLGEERFEHNFENVKNNNNKERDSEVYGFPDMHDVRPKVESASPNPKDVLSPEIIELCNGMEFWRI